MRSLTLAPAGQADLPGIADLMRARQTASGAAAPSRAALIAQLSDLPPGIGLLAARLEGQFTGFASWSLFWPADDLGRGLLLKQIHVAPAYRGRGLGRALIAGIARIAQDHRCTRIDFTADAENPELLAFYASLGALRAPRYAYHLIRAPQIATLAAQAG
ncbi:GNAT family N-acetyltransferase [Thioclava sp. BHET1]|nr:GNAT family N-acetyltransferase [Thioclava sp. BHET1]